MVLGDALLMTVSIHFTRDSGWATAMWTANAFVLGMILRRPKSEWPFLLGVSFLTKIAVGSQAVAILPALIMTMGNTAEIFICLSVLSFGCGPGIDLSRPRHLKFFVGVAVVAPVVSSCSLLLCYASETIEKLVPSYFAHVLGLLVLTPAMLTIEWASFSKLFKARNLQKALWLSLGLCCVLFGVFIQSTFLYLFFVPGVLILVAFNASATAAAVALLAAGAVATTATLMGSGPLAVIHASLRERLFDLQVFLLAVTVSVLPMAAAVADRRRLEARLREALDEAEASEARYRLLTENANDIITEMDGAGRFKYVSPSVQTVTGYDVDEVVGRSVWDFIHPDDRKRVRAAFTNALSGAAEWQIVYRLVCKTGRIIWVEAHPNLRRTQQAGRRFTVTDVIRDITERKAAEDALAESESRYRLLADNSHDIILRYGTNLVISYISPSSRRLGYDPDELIGRSILSLIYPDDVAAANHGVEAPLAGAFLANEAT